MKKIFIVGAGGLGLEILDLINEINVINKEFEFKAFIDNNKTSSSVSLGNKIYDVIDEDYFIEKNKHNPDISIVVGIGNPDINFKVSSYYSKNTNFNFPNLIHPKAYVNMDNVKLGNGNIFMSNSYVSVNADIGNFNIINLNCTIGHDVNIKNNNIINPGVNVSGTVKIGDRNLLGTNSAIIQNLRIGNNNLISAGSLIFKDIGNNSQLMGNPARVIRNNK